MERYISKKPTAEKKRFFEFMERNKRGGVVGTSKLRAYIKAKGHKVKTYGIVKTATSGYGKKSNLYLMHIKGKKGSKIGEIGIKNKNKPRVVWWKVN